VTGALPAAIAEAEYAALHDDPGRWVPVVADLARRHGHAGAVQPVLEGSNLVALVGDGLVAKLFPPFLRHQYDSERLALRHLRGRLAIAIPAIVADDVIAGWPYLFLRRLDGVPLATVWDACGDSERCALLHAVGSLIAEVQAIPPGPLTTLEPRWKDFLAGQIAGCRARHERRGLPAHLLAALDGYLERTADVLPADVAPTILTGEYTPGNLLVSGSPGARRLSGLIDFGDVMVGFREYDLLGPSAFLAAGAPAQVRALLRGYGYEQGTATPGLGARLTRLLLLHRFSNLGVQVKVPGWQERARSFEELAELLWPPA
jgi:hygromycin-B 7''-O-kinase